MRYYALVYRVMSVSACDVRVQVSVNARGIEEAVKLGSKVMVNDFKIHPDFYELLKAFRGPTPKQSSEQCEQCGGFGRVRGEDGHWYPCADCATTGMNL